MRDEIFMSKELHYVITDDKRNYYTQVLSAKERSGKHGSMRFRLHHYRTQKGLTQAQVAEEIGISQGLYAQLESGKRRMNETYIEALADLYRIAPTQLIIDSVRDDPLYQQLDEAYRLLSPAERQILVNSAKGIAAASQKAKQPH